MDNVLTVLRSRALNLTFFRSYGLTPGDSIFGPMEAWQLEFEWLRVRHWVQDRFGKKELPDLNAVLFLVGMQEVGRSQQTYTKEEKQDLMHVAICHLLSEEGYFEFEGFDADGWPHWKPLIPVDIKGVAAQEVLLRQKVVEYFAPLLANQEK